MQRLFAGFTRPLVSLSKTLSRSSGISSSTITEGKVRNPLALRFSKEILRKQRQLSLSLKGDVTDSQKRLAFV